MTSNRASSLDSWNADWAGLRVVVLGLGVTGFSVADTLAELGCRVLVAADSIDETRDQILQVLGVETEISNLELGIPERVRKFDPEVVVISPGFAPHHPAASWALASGAEVWGDIELAWRLRDKFGKPAEWICVTGTNGKTTTVQLTAAMLNEGGFRVAACGNVGVPVLDAIRDPAEFEVLVVELSSFQLHYLGEITPWASACLNVSDDHLDWHSGAEDYRKSKGKVYSNTQVACVYNIDDPTTRELVEEADVVEGCRAIGFGLGIPGPSDFGIVDGIACDRAFLEDRANQALELFEIETLKERGLGSSPLIADSLASAALARSFGADIPSLRRAISKFSPAPHRVQVVAESGGVTWIDDSKATNPHAASASLSTFESVVWIFGGLFKGASPDDLVAEVASRLRGAVVIGAERALAIEALKRHAPGVPIIEVKVAETGEVMKLAVTAASRMAQKGDVVLLAPAAASMDQFVDYEDRGKQFASAVNQLVGGVEDDSNPTTITT